MKNKIASALFFCIFFAVSVAVAQEYEGSVGVRIGSAQGISYKTCNRDGLGLEGVIAYRNEGIQAMAWILQSREIGRTDTWLYAGVGAHGGVRGFMTPDQAVRPVYGADVVVGIEYVFPHTPMALSMDLKPLVELAGGKPVFSGNNGGVTLRFLL
ncbi:MAG: hypothetical protein SF053_02910 [Bacteroidia bacterium]|nr:hypothetical protein [Bacteroidia bacterium]